MKPNRISGNFFAMEHRGDFVFVNLIADQDANAFFIDKITDNFKKNLLYFMQVIFIPGLQVMRPGQPGVGVRFPFGGHGIPQGIGS